MMYARRNNDGVSVNESAVCRDCLSDSANARASLEAWRDAEDTDRASIQMFPVDNPDAICIGCGRRN